MAAWAQALAITVVILATSPERDRVIKLEWPRCARRDIDQLTAACTVWTISEPDAQARGLTTTATITSRSADPLRLLQGGRLEHLHTDWCRRDAG